MMSRLRNIVQHNLPAKALALVIAVILWGYVMNDQNPSIESTYTVQLDVVNAPDGYKITKDASTVKLRVRGPRSLLFRRRTATSRPMSTFRKSRRASTRSRYRPCCRRALSSSRPSRTR